MVYKCSVPVCRGNYKDGPRVNVFSFPTDVQLRKKWIAAIKREDFEPTKNSKVCELHFRPEDVERETHVYIQETGERVSAPLKIPRLRKDVVPSRIPGAPSYLSSHVPVRESVDNRRTRIENSHLEQAISESLVSKRIEDSRVYFSTLDELNACLSTNELLNILTIVSYEDTTTIGSFTVCPSPSFKYCISISSDLKVKAYQRSVEIQTLDDLKFPVSVNNIYEIRNILYKLKCVETAAEENIKDLVSTITCFLNKLESSVAEDKQSVVQFLKEQLNLLCLQKQRFRYSPNCLIFACILHSISPHAYTFLRNSRNLILPHAVTLRNICSNLNVGVSEEQQDAHFLNYIKKKFTTLKQSERHIILMMDEIHLKAFYDYKGGNLVGSAFDSVHAASSAHTFMIRSLLSDYKDVAHILPVKSFTAEALFTVIKRLILGLEEIGLKVVCVVSDNNSINRKAMSFFNEKEETKIYENPYEPSRPLFFVIDSVHLLKCIRNNWINQKNDYVSMHYPKFKPNDSDDDIFHIASFYTLRKLHELEYDNLMKYGYGLTLKALWPSNLEKQNVKLVLQIFNEWVIVALPELGKKHNLSFYESTSCFIDIFYKWWCIVNTKTPLKGKRLKSPFQEPLTFSESDKKFQYLNDFLNWLDEWDNVIYATGCLTKETHNALRHTTYTLLELGKYCINELGMSYFLPGKIQTDLLEDRFGKYRQLSGSQYCISIRQVFESESKLRMQSFLPLTLTSNSLGNVIVTEVHDGNDIEDNVEDFFVMDDFPVLVTEHDIVEAELYIPILTYLTGYCIYSTFRKHPCEFCKEITILNKALNIPDQCNLIRKLDRGGLLYPMPHVINIVLYNYIVMQKLVSENLESKFLKHPSQRQLVVNLTLNALMCDEAMDIEPCSKGHSFETIAKRVIWSSTNTLLNNYCKKKNDLPKLLSKKNDQNLPSDKNDQKPSKKRKLTTLVK